MTTGVHHITELTCEHESLAGSDHLPRLSRACRMEERAMTSSAPRSGLHLSAPEFVSRAAARLSLDAPQGLTDPDFVPRHDDDDPAVIAAIAAMRPIRTSAVLVPIVARRDLTVLFTQRTSHLRDHAGQIAFPGGKIDDVDVSPAAAALREAEEEIALHRRFVEPLGYLDVWIVPSGYRVVPTLALVREGFSLSFSRNEVVDAFEVPLAFLMEPQNHRRERAEWNGLPTSVYAIAFGEHKIWGVTAGILRNLWERIYAV
jgi:8-oxo-dGTP pyrophosphatase MutT (NUDIX family)